MIDGVPLNLMDAGGWAVTAGLGIFIVLAFVRGHIYPSSTVKTLLEENATRLQSEKERADAWQLAWNQAQAARSAEAEGDRALLIETARTAKNVLEAIQQAADRGSEET